MPIYASAGETTTFQPAPEGVHQAVCVDVIDKGLVDVVYQGTTKKQHKINIAWQIGEVREDGKPFLVYKRYTLSIHEKAALRKDLESWRGRAFTPAEEAQFDVETVIGANCLLNIQHATRGDKIYANVVSIMPLVKGMPKITGRDYQRVSERPHDAPTDRTPPDEYEGTHSAPVSQITDDDIPF